MSVFFFPTGSSGSWQEINAILKRALEENLMEELNIYRGVVGAKEPMKDGKAPRDQQQGKATAVSKLGRGVGGSVVAELW